MDNIIMIGGCKGGVGKSMVSIAFAENYIMSNKPLYIVETDTSNPDVGKVYADIEGYKPVLLNLDEKDGWLDLIEMIEKVPSDTDILINSAARSNTGVNEHGNILNDYLPDLKRKLITFWPINKEQDSIQLLKQYLNIMTNSKIFVLLNAHYGSEEKFDVYHNSTIVKNMVDENGGEYMFPDLADRVVKLISNKRQAPHKYINEMPIGTRIECTRWLKTVKTIMDKTIFSEPENHPTDIEKGTEKGNG